MSFDPRFDSKHVSVTDVARAFRNGRAKQSCFASPETSKYNRAVRVDRSYTPSPSRDRSVKGKAAKKAAKRLRQRMRLNGGAK